MPVEALLLTAHMAVYPMIVMVAALLSTILTVTSKKRKYAQRKPKEEDPTRAGRRTSRGCTARRTQH